jgi:hypothetical protein
MWDGRSENVDFKIGTVRVSKYMFIRVSKHAISLSIYWLKTQGRIGDTIIRHCMERIKMNTVFTGTWMKGNPVFGGKLPSGREF